MSRIAAAAVLAAAPIAFTAPAAQATDSHSLHGTASPRAVHKGDKVHLELHGCHAHYGRASSTAFGHVTLHQPKHHHGHGKKLVGTAYVHKHAHAGPHKVRLQCDGDHGKTTFAAIKVLPKHGAHAGGGGSVGGMSTTETAAGAALVATAIGGGVLVMRRRARGNV
ncbi:hypothetical protein [Streptomyces sp. URMC 123]|uniref:hypothetical protein n=1 Tax=Streptomyces sp. URMC 123 TaxID=3423403 RepID=UPI003F1D5C05